MHAGRDIMAKEGVKALFSKTLISPSQCYCSWIFLDGAGANILRYGVHTRIRPNIHFILFL